MLASEFHVKSRKKRRAFEERRPVFEVVCQCDDFTLACAPASSTATNITRKRASKSREALAPPGRPAARPTASYAGDRYDDDYESADDSGLGNGAAGGMVDLVNLPDSDDEPTGRVLKGLKRRNGSPGEEHDDEEGGRLKDMEQEEEEEEEDVAAPAPAPRNPFARGKTFSSPPRKKKKVAAFFEGSLPFPSPSPPPSTISLFLSEVMVGLRRRVPLTSSDACSSASSTHVPRCF